MPLVLPSGQRTTNSLVYRPLSKRVRVRTPVVSCAGPRQTDSPTALPEPVVPLPRRRPGRSRSSRARDGTARQNAVVHPPPHEPAGAVRAVPSGSDLSPGIRARRRQAGHEERARASTDATADQPGSRGRCPCVSPDRGAVRLARDCRPGRLRSTNPITSEDRKHMTHVQGPGGEAAGGLPGVNLPRHVYRYGPSQAASLSGDWQILAPSR